jgi:hypothetical protein
MANLGQADITWEGDFGLLRREKLGKRERYDLVERTPQGYRYYFGVTDDGIHGPWKDWSARKKNDGSGGYSHVVYLMTLLPCTNCG